MNRHGRIDTEPVDLGDVSWVNDIDGTGYWGTGNPVPSFVGFLAVLVIAALSLAGFVCLVGMVV